MQVDINYSHKYFTVYSGYRPVGELFPEEFSVELTQPLLDVREIKLDYAQFPNCIVPLEGLTFSWVENSYLDPITSFPFPSTFMSPLQTLTYIQTQMTALSPNGYVYTLTLDATTGIISWASTGNFSLYMAGITTSGYNLGLNQVADGRAIYPGVPQFYTPLGLSFTAPWPLFNREWGIAVHVRPWSSDTCSNDTYLDTHQFVIPLGSSNYGDIVQFHSDSQFRQNIAWFQPGNSYKRLFFTIRRWVDSFNHITQRVNLHGEILLRFSYSTYRDTLPLLDSLTLSS